MLNMMKELWKTLNHREQTAEWHRRVDARDPRNENQAGHQHVVDIFKDAFTILNDGVEFSQDNRFICPDCNTATCVNCQGPWNGPNDTYILAAQDAEEYIVGRTR